jgi:hypothetical protein
MDFPSNSKSEKVLSPEQEESTEEKVVLKVVTGNVVRRKKPLGNRFMETFFGGDGHSVVDYVIKDVLLPAAKDMVADAVSQGIERMIFGESRAPGGRRASARGINNGPVNYGRYSATSPVRKDPREESRPISRRSRSSHDFDEIILATRGEADEVIDKLYDMLQRYGTVSVSDLYELVGSSASYTDEKWGWTDLRRAGVTRTRNGYLLNLPAPEPLD